MGFSPRSSCSFPAELGISTSNWFKPSLLTVLQPKPYKQYAVPTITRTSLTPAGKSQLDAWENLLGFVSNCNNHMNWKGLCKPRCWTMACTFNCKNRSQISVVISVAVLQNKILDSTVWKPMVHILKPSGACSFGSTSRFLLL